MKINHLGGSGLKVSELCFGAMTFGSTGKFNEIGKVGLAEPKEMVDIAMDAGINFFDTADAYSNGASEEMLGKALGKKRKDVIICTKFRFNAGGSGQNDDGASRSHIIEACNASLKRLDTDYIDVYMAHSMDIHTPLEETLSALNDLVRMGKVRYIGCSNYSGWYLMKAICISEKHNLERFITYQGYYSLLSRELENEIVPLCLDQELGIMIWSPLAAGYLTGKCRRDKPIPDGTRIGDHKGSIFIPPTDEEKMYDIIDKLDEIAKNHGVSIPQVSLNYILKKPAVSTAVIGTRKKEQLMDNIKTTEWDLEEAEIKKLDELSKTGYIYPYWHHESTGVND
jgi:aryl-alcohol dehydrogenase-like predicted oxidoreductase